MAVAKFECYIKGISGNTFSFEGSKNHYVQPVTDVCLFETLQQAILPLVIETRSLSGNRQAG